MATIKKTTATATKKAPKKRAAKYEKPVTFDGTFDYMIAISITGAGVKKKEEIKKS